MRKRASEVKTSAPLVASRVARIVEIIGAALRNGTAPTLREVAESADISAPELIEAVYARTARRVFHPTRKKKKNATRAWLLDGRLVPAERLGASFAIVLEDALLALRTDSSTCFPLSGLLTVVFSPLQPLFKGPEVRRALLERRGPPAVGVLLARKNPVIFLMSDVLSTSSVSRADEASVLGSMSIVETRRVTEAEGRPYPKGPSLSEVRPERADQSSGVFEERFEAAFAELDQSRGGRNFLLLREMREALSKFSPQEFDAGLRRLRLAQKFTLLGFDGRHEQLDEADIAAGIVEANRRLVYVSRKE